MSLGFMFLFKTVSSTIYINIVFSWNERLSKARNLGSEIVSWYSSASLILVMCVNIIQG